MPSNATKAAKTTKDSARLSVILPKEMVTDLKKLADIDRSSLAFVIRETCEIFIDGNAARIGAHAANPRAA